jgi:hypothetical protein
MMKRSRLLPVARPVLQRLGFGKSCAKSAVLFLMAFQSACVLPLAPEFEDPPAAQNFAPLIVDSFPVNGAVVSTPMFRVTVDDPNVADVLYVRWIADFPPFNDSSRRLGDDVKLPPPATGMFRPDVVLNVDCTLHALARTTTTHQIMVVVADRPFRPPDQETSLDRKLTSLPIGAPRAEAHWTLNLECNK